MRLLIVVLLGVGLIGHPGCTKSASKGQTGGKAPGEGSVKEAARAFVEATVRRDTAGVNRMLYSYAVCRSLLFQSQTCREYAQGLQAMVAKWMRGIPKDFKVERVEVRKMTDARYQNLKLALVYPKGGGTPAPVMVKLYNKRFFVVAGMKRK